MKIIQMQAENVKKLRAVEITPNGEIVVIAGRNGQGKTSVLDSIWWALAGSANIQAQPIRKGESKARIRLDLGELVVERRFTEGGSQLFVENKEGARYPSPQKLLDELIGRLSFDPLAFARMDARKQFDELRKIVHLDVDIDQLDGLNRSDYSKRTDVNRDAKAKRAAAEAILIPEGLPPEPVDENEILNRIEQAGEKNLLIERRRSARADMQRAIDLENSNAQRARTRAAELRSQADMMDREAEVHDAKSKELQQSLADAAPLPDRVDITDLRHELDRARAMNHNIGARDRRRALEGEVAELEEKSAQLTSMIESRAKAKAEAISAADMPVDGLGFGDGFVIYRGIPFDQCSSAEQLRVSLSIAMAANPKLKIIRIQDGSLLDEESLAAIGKMTKAADYQVWIERVDTSGKIGVVIEDGAVIAVDGEPVPVAAAAA